MRLISYEEDGAPRIGVVTDGESFVPVHRVAPALPSSLKALLAMPDGLARLKLHYPEVDAKQRADLRRAKRMLQQESRR